MILSDSTTNVNTFVLQDATSELSEISAGIYCNLRGLLVLEISVFRHYCPNETQEKKLLQDSTFKTSPIPDRQIVSHQKRARSLKSHSHVYGHRCLHASITGLHSKQNTPPWCRAGQNLIEGKLYVHSVPSSF